MSYDHNRHHRRSLRCPSADYKASGAYFITVRALKRGRSIFGRVVDGAFCPNVYGKVVVREWMLTASKRQNVLLDEWIVMPDHFHAILFLEQPSTLAPAARAFGKPQAQAVPTIIGAFKSGVQREVSRLRVSNELPPASVWQRNFHDRIIRDEAELEATRRYIRDNPLRWRAEQ